MCSGCVLWITGLSGAGKTTLGSALHKKLPGSIFLDGDELRMILGAADKNYDREGRINLAKTYSRLANLLANQGFTVIVATISLFHEVQTWNRANMPNYVEIFLNISEATRIARDPKKLYRMAADGIISNLAGRNVAVEFPRSPDITFTEAISLDNSV